MLKRSARHNGRGAMLPTAVVWLGLVGLLAVLMGTSAECVPPPVTPPTEADTDGDTVVDASDNCVSTANTDQANADGDGICGDLDNCPSTSNASQTDSDSDGTGDACDTTPLPSPTADAGSDQSVNGGTSATLTALASGGTAPYTFAWRLTSSGTAGSVTLTNAATQIASAAFSADAAGAFVFEVTVTDANSQTSSDSMTVTATATGVATGTTFTLDSDDLTGTTGDDTFNAPLIFSAGAGAQVASFQTGDQAAGLAGTDTLNVNLNAVTNPVPTSMTDIEILNATCFAANTITVSNFTGLTTVNTVGSTANLTINPLSSIVDCGFNSVVTATTLALTYQAAATTSPTTGSTDTFTLTMTDTTAGTLVVTTAANGFESVSISSEGTTANILTALTQTTGTTLATATLSGTNDLSIGIMPTTVLTYDAASMTGGLTLGTGTTAVGGTAYVAFPLAAANLTDLDTGTGDDEIIFAATLNTNDFASATCDLGAGTDIVQATFAASYGTAMPFRNVEEFRFNCTGAATVNMNGITGLATLTNDHDGAATAITIQNIPSTSGVFPTLNYRGLGTQVAQIYDTVTYAATGNTGSSDTLPITVGNRGTALNVTGTTNVHTMGAITATGFELVNVTVTDGPATFGGITASTMNTFTATASSNLTLGTVGQGAGTPALVTANCSAVTGNLSATFDYVASGAVITTGAGNDTVTVGTNAALLATVSSTLGAGNDTYVADTSSDGVDTVNAGTGTDTITGGGGNDTITTGSGNDTVIYDQATANDQSDITDFTPAAGGDVMQFDISALSLAGGTEFVGLLAAVVNTDEIVVLTTVGYASDDLAEDALAGAAGIVAGTDMVVIYFNTTTNTTHIIYDADAGADGADGTAVLLGNLTNVILQATHDTLTIANIASQA